MVSRFGGPHGSRSKLVGNKCVGGLQRKIEGGSRFVQGLWWKRSGQDEGRMRGWSDLPQSKQSSYIEVMEAGTTRGHRLSTTPQDFDRTMYLEYMECTLYDVVLTIYLLFTFTYGYRCKRQLNGWSLVRALCAIEKKDPEVVSCWDALSTTRSHFFPTFDWIHGVSRAREIVTKQRHLYFTCLLLLFGLVLLPGARRDLVSYRVRTCRIPRWRFLTLHYPMPQ